jgi:hypothetical protein
MLAAGFNKRRRLENLAFVDVCEEAGRKSGLFAFRDITARPKSSPKDGNLPRRPREIWRFKNRANIEDSGNREIREICETGKLAGEESGFFAYFVYFAVQRIS